MFHAYQIFSVSFLHDSDITRVQLLSSTAKTNKVHDHTVPFYELAGIVEVLFEIRKLVNYLRSKNLCIPSKNQPGRIQVLTYALPTTYNKSMAKNELFSIVNKDYITLQSKELIASVLVYGSNLHYELTVKARTNSYHNIPLKDYSF